MTDPQQLAAAQKEARRTYDRRRARKAADLLATITPDRWDDATRSIIATLATMTAPSRINDLLDRELPWDMPSPRDPSWANLPELVEDARRAAAADETEMDERERASYSPPCTTPCGEIDCEVVCSRDHDTGTSNRVRTLEEVRNGVIYADHSDRIDIRTLRPPVERCPDHPDVAADVCGVTACMTRRIAAYTRALDTGEHPKACGPGCLHDNGGLSCVIKF